MLGSRLTRWLPERRGDVLGLLVHTFGGDTALTTVREVARERGIEKEMTNEGT